MDANPDRTLRVASARPRLGRRVRRAIQAPAGWVVAFAFTAMASASVCVTTDCDAASVRTRNFIVDAPSPQLARTVGDAAERYRDELATYWTGSTLPPWPTPCPIRVVAGPNLAAQGVTTYNPAPVRDFQMEVIGSPERILDSVLPHEVTHTVLATYFGRPLPRWADEGICTTVEHISERTKHEAKLREFLSTRRGIPMNTLMRLTEYPPDVLPMYAQGYSVCRFLIEQQGPQKFVSFLKDYMRQPSWTANVKKYYGYDSLAELQEYWLAWVEAGSGPVAQFAKLELPSSQNSQASLASRDIITRQASVRQPSPATSQIAPSTNLGSTGLDASSRNAKPDPSLIAANDRGRVSEADSENGWYHRRAAGEDLNFDSESQDRSSGAETVPPGNHIAVAAPRSTPETSSVPNWAPPSVMSSGRYSAATPQPESSGSIRGQSPAIQSGTYGSRGVNDTMRSGRSSTLWR